MLKEIEQVGRLLDSEQTGACLAYVESLEKSHPNCACLTAAKLTIYRSENRWAEALSVAERFRADEPDNPTAAAEYAMALVVTGNPKLAISTLVDGFERSKADSIHTTLIRGALQVGAYLMLGKLTVPAIAIGNVLKEIPAIAESANRLLYNATADTNVPLILRDWAFEYQCPDNFPGKATFEEAVILVHQMRWKQALALLEPLTHLVDSNCPDAQHANVWPGIWRNIAVLHFWLLDNDKGSEALKAYASHPNTPTEDAVDAESTRLLFNPDPFGDQTEELIVECTITDVDAALEKLLSDPLFRKVDAPGIPFSPPPRACFQMLDRPFSDSETAMTLENISSQRAVAILFGKETDREARLLLFALTTEEQETVETNIQGVLGDLVQVPGKTIDQKPVSKTRLLSDCRLYFPQKREAVEPEVIEKIIIDYFGKSFVEAWLALPLGLLDGKTPIEAAKEPTYTVPLLAAIQIIEEWMPEDVRDDVSQTFRSRLGLPTPETITITESSGDNPLEVLDGYPVWRWHRFDVSKLSTDILAGGLQIALGMREMRATVRFAEELLCRPMDSMSFPIRIMAFEALISASQGRGAFDNALLWVERAKNESTAQEIPDAAWCLHEIMLRLMQGDTRTAHDVIQYVATKYRDDAAVMNALQELFVRIGMLNPDGTPSAAFKQAQAAQQAEEQEQKIWTPDGSTPAGSGGASKLWVPD